MAEHKVKPCQEQKLAGVKIVDSGLYFIFSIHFILLYFTFSFLIFYF